MKRKVVALKDFFKENIIGVIGVAVLYLWNVFYQVWQGQNLLDSDMASEIILADVLNKNHAILTNEWIYSTELEIFSMQWIYRLGLILFPWNWHLVRTFATAVAMAIFALLIIFLFHSMKKTKWGFLAAMFAMFPCGGWYFWQTLFGGYYIFTICISVATLGLCLSATEDIKSLRAKIYVALMLILSLLKGMSDIRQAMYFYLPFFVASCVMYIAALYQRGNTQRSIKIVALSFICTVINILGYLFNTLYLAKKYPYLQYESMKISAEPFIDKLRDFILSYGFIDGKELFSLPGIASIAGVIMGGYVVFSAVRLLTKLNKLTFEERVLVLTSISSIIVTMLTLTYLEEGSMRYYQPVLPFGLFLGVMELATEDFMSEKHRKISIASILMMMLITSAGTVYNEMNEPIHDFYAKPQLNIPVKLLCDMGYTKGVSNFFTSNIVTELSDGQIEMWTIIWGEIEPDPWLQKRSHLEGLPEENYFFIYDKTMDPLPPYSFAMEHPDLAQIYEDDYCIVFGN
ncbi:MAG: hypothetical protein IJ608_12865 [Lachnospiraceae bacterium]|nr:hypothetical protein [Lachnospiraceae bacterium]